MQYLVKFVFLSGFIVLSLGFINHNYAQDLHSISLTHNQVKNLIQSHPDSAIEISKNLLPLVSGLKSDSMLAKTHFYLALAYYYKGYYNTSISHYKQASLTNYAKHDLKFQSRCRNNLGVNYDLLEKYVPALENYLETREIDIKLNDSTGAAYAQINIGLLYSNLGQWKQAETILLEARKFFRRRNHLKGMALANQNLGKVYMDRKMFDEAMPYLINAKQLYQQAGELYELGILYISLTTCMVELNDFDRAGEYINKAINIGEERGYDYLLTRAQLSKANLHIHQGNFEKAEKNIERVNTKNLRSEINRIKMLVNITAGLNDYQKFQSVFDRYLHLQDSLTEIKNTKLINELHIQHKTEIKNELLASQKKLIVAYKNQNLFLVFSVLAVLLFLLFIMYFNRKLKKSYRTLFEKNQELSRNSLLNDLITTDYSSKRPGDALAKPDQQEALWLTILSILKEDKPYNNPDFSLEQLAKLCNSNKTYITRAISLNTQSNFKTLINRFRIEEARALLKENKNFSIDAIAEHAGFNSLTSFYRAFKNFTGLTPAQYKKYLDQEEE